MKFKSVLLVAAMMIMLMAFSGSALGQVTWNQANDAADATPLTAGTATTLTLKFTLGEVSQLTRDQWLELDISDFLYNAAEVTDSTNYVFTSSDATLEMDSNGDFSVSVVHADSVLRVTLDNESALVPADSEITLTISNVFYTGGQVDGVDDFHVAIRTEDQPLWSTEADNDNIITIVDAPITAVSVSDSVASNASYMTFGFTTTTVIPKDGVVTVYLPDSTLFTSADSAWIKKSGVALTTTQSASGGALTFTLNESDHVALGSALTIELGNASNKIVTNPPIYVADDAFNNDATRTASAGFGTLDPTNAANDADFDIYVYGKNGSDYISHDNANAGATYELKSNYFEPATANGGLGSVLLYDNRAGFNTQVDIDFKVSTRQTLADVDTLVFFFDPLHFVIENGAAEAATATNYTFTAAPGSGVSLLNSGEFTVDVANIATGYIAFPIATTGVLPSDTAVKLSVASAVLKNLGSQSDVRIGLRTADQTSIVYDSDDDPIIPDPAGYITAVNFGGANVQSGEQSDVVVFTFTTPTNIPADAIIGFQIPAEFTPVAVPTAVSFDPPGGEDWTIGTTELAAAWVGNELRLTVGAGGTRTEIAAGGSIVFTLNDVFVNPDPQDCNIDYPAEAGDEGEDRAPFVITVYDANMNELMQTDNYDDTAANQWNYTPAAVAWSGNMVTYAAAATTEEAGSEVGMIFTFEVGNVDDATTNNTITISVPDNFWLDQNEAANATNAWTYTDGVNLTANVNVAFNGGDGNDIVITPQGTWTPYAAAAYATVGTFTILDLGSGVTAGDNTYDGGAAFAKGEDTDIRFEIESADQSTQDQTTQARALTITKLTNIGVDGGDATHHTMNNSTFGESSYNTFVLDLGAGSADAQFVPPSSRMAIKLSTDATYGGFQFITANATSANIDIDEVDGPVNGAATVTGTVTTDSMYIVMDAVALLTPEATADVTRIELDFGESTTTNVMTNPSGSASPTSRTANVGDYNDTATNYQLFETFVIYDDQDRVIYEYSGSDDVVFNLLTNVVDADEGTITNTVDFGAGVNANAGAIIATLDIPVTLGEPLVAANNDSIRVILHGAILDTANLVFGDITLNGDIAGGGTDQPNAILIIDDSTFVFEVPANMGADARGDVAVTDDDEFEIVIANSRVITLGDRGADDFDAEIITTQQSTGVLDLDTSTFTVLTPNQSAPVFSSNVAGAALDYTDGGWNDGTAHGVVLKNGRIRVAIPVSQDSTRVIGGSEGVYAYSLVAAPAAAKLTSLEAAGFTVQVDKDGDDGGAQNLTIGSGIDSIYYSVDSSRTLVSDVDTAFFDIYLTASQDFTGVDDGVEVDMTGLLYNPREATGDQNGDDDFEDDNAENGAPFHINVSVADMYGNLISYGDFAAARTITAGGTATNYVVVVEGQQHDPGGLSVTGGQTASPTGTVNQGVPFAVYATDDYGNIVAGYGAGNYVSLTTYSAALDGANFSYIGDEEAGSAEGELEFAAGVARFGALDADYTATGAEDSLLFFVAGDNDATQGRSWFSRIRADEVGGSIGAYSDGIDMAPGAASQTFVLLQGETYTPGDTVNSGKDPLVGTIELKQGSTDSVYVWPVDDFFNRTADPYGAAANHITLTAETGLTYENASGTAYATGSAIAEYDETGNNDFIFFVRASAAGSYTITVTDGGVNGSVATVDLDVVAGAAWASFAALADSTETAGRTHPFSVDLAFPGAYAPSGGWSIFTHTDPGLTRIPEAVSGYTDPPAGATLQFSQRTEGEGQDSTTAVTFADNVDVITEPEDSTVYIYAVLPEVSDSVIARSEGFVILHHPLVDTVNTNITPSAGDITLDSGSTPQSQTLDFKVVDVNNISNVQVWLFLSDDDTLGVSDFVPATPALGSAIRITDATGADALDGGSDQFLFDVLDTLESTSSYMEAGEFYVYVAAYDGRNSSVIRSWDKLNVKHSPSITLDRPLAGTTNIDTKDQTNISISWAVAGDFDRDDAAKIALYYDLTALNHANWGALSGSATAKQITDGFEIDEDDDSSELYVWDLTATATADLPADGSTYDIYAVIADTTDTVVAVSQGDISFTHSPEFKFKLNLGAGLTKGAAASQITVDKGEIFRIDFDAFDLDADQFIRLFITQHDTSKDYDFLSGGGVLGTTAWFMNSADGSTAPAGTDILTTDSTYYDWFSDLPTNLDQNGDYNIIAFISNDGNNAAWSNALTDKVVANGKLKLSGRERTSSQRYDLRAVPSVVSASQGDTVLVKLLIDSDGQAINQFAVYMDIDTSLFAVADPDTPIVYTASDFLGSTADLQDTAYVSGDKWFVDFEKAVSPAGATVAAGAQIGYIKLVGKENTQGGTVNGEVHFSSDAGSGRQSLWVASGVPKTMFYPNPGIKVYFNPRGQLQGFVPLQGRENNNETITFELREVGSLAAITDATYRAENDLDGTINGVQIVTDQFGGFSLTHIPTGSYYLVANAEGYLSGQYPAFDIVAGDIIDAANPTFNNAAIPVDYSELKGGDVSSDLVTGTGDNIIDGADMTYLLNNFGAQIGVTLDDSIGDINADGRIDTDDMMIASANFNLEGIPPIFTKRSGNNQNARFEIRGIPDVIQKDREFTVEVWSRDVDDLFGYDYVLSYDASKFDLVSNGIQEGDFLRSRDGGSNTLFFTRDASKGTRVINMLLGTGKSVLNGDGIVTKLTFKSNEDGGHPDIALFDVKVGNSTAEMRRLGDVIQVPETYKLAQNYPNPFNPETNIRFQLPKNAHVTLKIFNVLGQEVKTLVSRDMKSGYHMIKWDGRNNFGSRVASGVYFYEIRTPEFKKAMKMLMIK